MYVKNKFDEEQWNLLMRLTDCRIPIKDGKYYIDDKTTLDYYPVLCGTRHSGKRGISKKLAKSITWNASDLPITLLYNNIDKFVFTEHSLFLIKEHLKMILRYCCYPETLDKVVSILEKLENKDE